MGTNIARLESKLLVISETIGVPVYDFDFDLHFSCEHPYRFNGGETCILRVGPLTNYAAQAAEKAELGLRLVNSPEEHLRASELECWYPLISDLTPATRVFDVLPSAGEVEGEFGWPVFIKGSRQTSKHNPKLSIASNPVEYAELRKAYHEDPILHWQRPVIRQFVPLDPIAGEVPGKVKPSREFRTFWWNGKLVGCGQYWYQFPEYQAQDISQGLLLAQEAARRVEVPFLVVDIARRLKGGWIVIECNDAQESGYAGLAPQILWRNILDTI